MTQSFHIAELCLSLEGEVPEDWRALSPAFESFFSPVEVAPDGVVAVRRAELPQVDASNAAPLCGAAHTWSAWSWQGKRVVVLKALSAGGAPWRHLECDGVANRWTVTTATELSFLPPGSDRPHPLAFPIGELVTIELLE
ncbi:MAG: hypothetical protein V1750_06535, partial [Acidobacteriota bacterium]